MSGSSSSAATALPTFALAAYFVAAMLILMPPLEVVFSLPSLEPASARWRFGAAGLVAGSLLLPLVGGLLGMVTAVLCGHQLVYRALLVVGWLVLAGLVVMWALFLLDALQIRREVDPALVRRFDLTVLKATVTHCLVLSALALILLSGVRARRMGRRNGAEDGGRNGVMRGATL